MSACNHSEKDKPLPVREGLVHSFESFGSVDGPGIRFIVFLKGCAMRCAYCHNPDTWHRDGAERWTADGILDRAERFRAYWGKKGGITVSGGEPLLQADFVTELFEKARQRGISTCLDTSAQPYRPMQATDSADKELVAEQQGRAADYDRLFRATDTVLLDIKHIDDDVHRRLTGHSNRNILACARRLDELGVPVWIRHVLVPGITDDDDSLYRLSAFLRTLKNIRRIDVLPYHTMGRYKWQQLGLDYPLADTPVPSAEQVEHARKILNYLSIMV